MKSMRAELYGVIGGIILAASAYAQPGPPMGGPGPGNAAPMRPRFSEPIQHRGWWMGSNFFPPELVMRHQKEIGLTEDQQAALRSEASKLAGHITDLRWELNASRETLAGLTKQEKPDEKAIMEELGKVLKIRDDMKLSHMEMLIHIKNILTPEQQAKLTEIRRHMEHNLWGAPGMGRQEMGAQPHVGPRLNFWPGTPRIPANVPPPPGGQQ